MYVGHYAYISQLFRSDLISAMKLPDSMHLDSSSFLIIKEQWRTEWEVGVQVSKGGSECVCVNLSHVMFVHLPIPNYEWVTRPQFCMLCILSHHVMVDHSNRC